GTNEMDAAIMNGADLSAGAVAGIQGIKNPIGLARKGLSATDWAEIDAAFEANRDPWSGPTGEYRALYSRIVNLVPAPYGLGG
ncbi:MAG: isoaspartyl peptidase/L-asparaginase, partial [Zoogloea sp.]|nr:isoaspartyl peptidase/L-asparaginase [Zoogloea sp.]